MMKTRTIMLGSLVGSMIVIGGCERPQCPKCPEVKVENTEAVTTTAAVETPASGAAAIAAALGITDHFTHEVLCQVPTEHRTPHLAIGEGFYFGKTGDRWVLIPDDAVADKRWYFTADLHREAPDATAVAGFDPACDLPAAAEAILNRQLTDDERALLDAQPTASGDVEQFRGRIGDIDHPDPEMRDTPTRCHEIKLSFYELTGTGLEELDRKHFFLEFQDCGHNWDEATAQLFHGGVYHGGND